ncbi:acetyltransferase [Vibrio neonatus]|uniref:acetyltransferase n=1 Tax=Vibrio neonatus TaxID=278860 RepID=UPI0021C44D33|nr:acetyltransferase [Vibrio neonatus]
MSDCDNAKLPIVIIGGGGHASVLADILLQQQREIVAIVCPDDINQRAIFSGITHLKRDADISRFSADSVSLVNGIGLMPKSSFRRKLNETFLSLGYRFETVISDSAIVSPFCRLEVGAQILPMSVIQAGATIGSHSIINTGAIVEHDCSVGSYNHIAPRATLCGDVETETNVYIGANATVIQGISVGNGAVVGAGACLTRDLASDMIAYPAKITTK